MTEGIIISVSESDNYTLDDIIDVIFNYYQINYDTNTLLDELRKLYKIEVVIIKNSYMINGYDEDYNFIFNFKSDIIKILQITQDEFCNNVYHIEDKNILKLLDFLNNNNLYNNDNDPNLFGVDLFYY